MELGKGAWNNVADVEALRDRMFQHMTNYDRILILRCFRPRPGQFDYELVEIPKALLLKAKNFPVAIKEASRQTPKPSECLVNDDDGALAYKLYFDGGTERKLQIQHLAKRNCITHAKWTLEISA
jgi:type II restriction enzyme